MPSTVKSGTPFASIISSTFSRAKSKRGPLTMDDVFGPDEDEAAE